MKNYTRRDFLKNSSALVAATAIGSSLSSVMPAYPIGLQLWSVRDYLQKDAVGTLKAIGKHGYNYTEGFGFSDGKWFGYTPKDFKKVLSDSGLTQKSGHQMVTSKDYDKSTKQLSDEFKKAVAAAAEVGQKYIVCPYMTDEDRKTADSVKWMADIFNQAGEYTKKAGLRFGYHNHDFEFTNRLDNGMLVYEIIALNTDPKLVTLQLDLCWVTAAKYNAVDWFKLYPGRFELAHFKDLKAWGSHDTAIIGEGVVDFKSILANRQKAGLKMLIVELENYKASSVEEVGVSLKNLKKMLA